MRREFAEFRKPVAVMVVGLPVAVGLIEGQSATIVMSHDGCVGPHHLLPGAAADLREGVAHLKGVGFGVFGDDIDGSSHGIGTEESRASTPHHLDTFNHGSRHLLKAINPSERTHHGTAVDQNL